MSRHTGGSPTSATGPAAVIVIDHRHPAVALTGLVEQVLAAAERNDRIVVWSDAPAPAGPARRAERVHIRPHPGAAWHDALLELVRSDDTLPSGDDPLVCIVDDAARPSGSRWLRELRHPVARGEADATAPASNAAAHPGCPPWAPDADATVAEIRDTATRCRGAGETRSIPSLHGPVACLSADAVRRSDPGATRLAELDLGPANVLELGRVYVHSTADIPRLSVCMIMKDEAADLADCLATLRPVADEIVIYDTGSTDGSVALARSLGATVIEGEWRNDFGWARNQALAAARGTWVLSIDADERLELDHGVIPELQGLLDDDPPIDRFVIDLFDLQGSVHAPVRSAAAVPMARLFRRRRCRWVGALHEQPDARPGLPPARSINLPGLRFLHRGYLDEIIRDKGKWARNLAVATAGLDRVPTSDKECFDLGRSLRSVGEEARAFALFERAADLGQNVTITRGALEFAVLSLLESGQAGEAQPYLDRLRALDGGQGPARYLQGWVHVHQRAWTEALACFEGITGYDDNFTGFRAESVTLALALTYHGLGRRAEAVRAALDTLLRNDQALEAWAVLFECSEAGAETDAEIAASIAPARLVPLAARLGGLAPSLRDRLFEAVWQVRPGDRVALAVASQIAPSLRIERQVAWSGRLRAFGLHDLCPLRKLADDGTRTVAERAAALAAGLANAGSEDLEAPLERLAGLLLDDELVALLDDSLGAGSPAAGAIVVGGATTPGRCVAIVATLHAHGFTTEALAVLAHGAELDSAETRRCLDAAPALRLALQSAARRDGREDLGAVLPDAA